MRQIERRLNVWLCGLAIAMCFGAGAVTIAQEPGPPPPDGMQGRPDMPPPKMNVDKEIANMTKRYGLSDTQKAQIRPILAEQQHKLEAVFRDQSLPPEERFSKMRAIHDEQVSRISEVLSDSQRAKYQKDQKRMDQLPGPGGPPPPPPGGEGGGPPLS
jgi:Spy/CpxP family protein refolding chaperone